jgi:hypothetical protein
MLEYAGIKDQEIAPRQKEGIFVLEKAQASPNLFFLVHEFLC